ncbi:uncharacterized protein LOC128170590 [Crassostrea angulata]|uniref:uncharacterized protein LOC128170590 n=1 Tax=Magallana angulata TaxID=2784310 RepID=UPI0022B168C2|nr:uncharacterized protein LOC128170590 [Crassostrea angulata]
MATTQGQDVVLCQLCSSPVEHHCNLCLVDLCSPCTLKHLADKTSRHEIVEFINRKKGPILAECSFHQTKRCEMYCRDCKQPTCVLCVTTTHKKHEMDNILEILQNAKQQVTFDLKELENAIAPKYKYITAFVTSSVFDETLSAIQDQEDELCRSVRDIGSKMRDKVSKLKGESETMNKEKQSLAAKSEMELNGIIQNSKSVLESADTKGIISYESQNMKFRYGLKEMGLSFPKFQPGLINEDQLQNVFGKFELQRIYASNTAPNPQKMMKTPVILNTIQSPLEDSSSLWKVSCEGAENVWTSGNDSQLYQINRSGAVLKNIKAANNVLELTIDSDQNIVFIVSWPDTKVYKYESNTNTVKTLLELSDWCPRGLCYTMNGDLLVSMRSLDEKQSKIVSYYMTRETQNDILGGSLFSVDSRKLLRLSENGNGDICVADVTGKAVLVVYAFGELRFKYTGNRATYKKRTSFEPDDIVNDGNFNILIGDYSNKIVHIIDCDGTFIHYIEHSCTGGISIDTDHNLVAGELSTGKIRIIKYFE